MATRPGGRCECERPNFVPPSYSQNDKNFKQFLQNGKITSNYNGTINRNQEMKVQTKTSRKGNRTSVKLVGPHKLEGQLCDQIHGRFQGEKQTDIISVRSEVTQKGSNNDQKQNNKSQSEIKQTKYTQ